MPPDLSLVLLGTSNLYPCTPIVHDLEDRGPRVPEGLQMAGNRLHLCICGLGRGHVADLVQRRGEGSLRTIIVKDTLTAIPSFLDLLGRPFLPF